MIDIRHLTISYEDKTVLRDFSIRIEAGEKICISGKSGCGKSSILHAILGFIPLHSGAIYYGETKLDDASSIIQFREQTAYLSQDISFPNQTVKELIDEPFRYKANLRNRPSTERILSVLAELNLKEEIYHKQLNELSGGQKQRVLLALVKLLDKPIVLLDEPTSALDRASATLVAQLLRQMENKIVVAVTHDPHFATFFQKTIYIEE